MQQGSLSICSFFSFGDIDWSKKLIKALILEDTKWVSRIMPIPTVIYDRCFGKYGRENSLKLRNALGKDFKIINSMPKLAKWETIMALRKNPKLLSHIPITSQYHSYEDVELALKKYKALYLKPDLLYKGKGVFKVSLDEKNNYIVEHRNTHDNEIIHLSNLKNLDMLLNKYRAAGGGYLIQKEIKKASFKGYPFDLRVLFQKNWKGLWVVSGIAVRLGAGSIITSPRSGGAVEEISTILREVFQEDITESDGLYENLIDIGKSVVLAIEKEFGDCVELGLDMSIDVNGEIWIIEVNGKPLKVSLKWLNNPIIMDRCYNRPIEYAVFLTGFHSSDLELEADI
ncbi:hypothetical protein Q428_02380 [Fervidicella metallireducens AeB]|uniref:ATP-grasp domain-containing protein n=1 Tax=Fervidicella metallireducens AeB TaxID=1403537 RepID=A0A017S000_9CLOT|nr:YheC/YheD family protein [Fervidicella metallireducens]EYE89495.1 hypothetical protein Q428_02380 [Fervidicella metallireducens AeB]